MLKRITGFYASWGSTDLPANFDINKPFGFDSVDSSVPVFGYSLNQIYKAFVEPRTIKCVVNSRNLGIQPQVGELIAESDDNDSVKDINVSDVDWQNVFKAFDFIYNHQAAIENNSHTDTVAFNSWADEQLGSAFIEGESNINYVSNYKIGSFLDTRWSTRSRIESFTIIFTIDNANVEFIIYLVPDEFVTTSVLNNNKFSVWTMIDLEDDGKITDSELETQALDKIEEIMMQGSYISRIRFETAWRRKKTGDESGYHDSVVRKFYIYTNISQTDLAQVTPSMQKSLVQTYILTESELKINGDRTEAAKQYPDLFSDQGMTIVPVYNNVIETEGDSIKKIHPLSFDKIEEVKTRFYNTNLLLGEPKAEWFYLPTSANGSASAYHIFPILAIEDTSGDDYTYPISSRFPDYDLTPYNSSTGSATNKTVNFQFSLSKIITFLVGDAEEDSIMSIPYISSVEVISASYTSPKIVKFIYEGTLYTVYGVWDDI